VVVGSARMLRERGVEVEEAEKGAVMVAVEGVLVGTIAMADAIKGTTREALAMLRAEGVRVVMVTGDAKATADAVARELGIEEVVADALPEDKERRVAALKGGGHVVAVAGDGVNDAPALARADVGIAMGTGTDVAMASAGVTLVRGDLRGIVRARRIARATMQNVRQNLLFAFAYNAIGVPIAAGALYPLLGLLLSPMIASLAMTFSSVSVIANALRLRRVDA
jgi:Cu+-exporting ATPase